MKNINKKIQIFVVIFSMTFSQVSYAGPFTGLLERLRAASHALFGTADDAARDTVRSTPIARQGDDAGRLVGETVGDNGTILDQILTKVVANANIIGSDILIAKAARILRRKSKAAPVIVAPAGSGKSANIQAMQHAIDTRNPDVENLWGHELYFLNINSLIGGTSHRGDLEKKFSSILVELAKPENANKIIVIDELENVLKNQYGKEFLESLKSYFTSDMPVKFIFNITPGPYDELMKDPQLVRRMFPIFNQAPGLAVVRRILLNLSRAAEEIDGIKVSSEQIESILRLSQLNTQLSNPDVAITMFNDAVLNAVADLATGSDQIRQIRVAVQNIQGQIDIIENMRNQDVVYAFGPYYDRELAELERKKQLGQGIMDSYNASRRQSEISRNALRQKISERANLTTQLRTAKLNNNVALVNELETQIELLAADIDKLGQEITDINPFLMAGQLKEEHIVDSAAANLNANEDYVLRQIRAESRAQVVERVSSRIYGQHKQAIASIVRRSKSLKALGQQGDIPAFLIVHNRSSEGDKLVKEVVSDITGHSPFKVDSLEIKTSHDMARIQGSTQGLIGSGVEGPLYKQARITQGRLGLLFSGVEMAIADMLNFAEEILKNKVVRSNMNQDIDFSQSHVFLTAGGMPPLTDAQRLELDGLTSEFERQALLRRYIKENFQGRINPENPLATSVPMNDELLEKLHIIYLDEVHLLDEQKKAILADNLRDRALQVAVGQEMQISMEFSDEAIDLLYQRLVSSSSANVSDLIANDVIGFVDDLIQRHDIIPGDHIVFGVRNGQITAEPLAWVGRNRPTRLIENMMEGAPQVERPDGRQQIRDALNELTR